MIINILLMTLMISLPMSFVLYELFISIIASSFINYLTSTTVISNDGTFTVVKTIGTRYSVSCICSSYAINYKLINFSNLLNYYKHYSSEDYAFDRHEIDLLALSCKSKNDYDQLIEFSLDHHPTWIFIILEKTPIKYINFKKILLKFCSIKDQEEYYYNQFIKKYEKELGGLLCLVD